LKAADIISPTPAFFFAAATATLWGLPSDLPLIKEAALSKSAPTVRGTFHDLD
jgi:hypothetical protein